MMICSLLLLIERQQASKITNSRPVLKDLRLMGKFMYLPGTLGPFIRVVEQGGLDAGVGWGC